ncbi:MAG: 30S ribosomal protein S6, partial [Caldilineae bacterium]
MRNYELMLIVRPSLDLEAAVETAKKVAEQAESLGGQVVDTKVWGRRKLAYPIEKLAEGTYILLNLAMPPAALKELDFNLKLNENLLRYLLVKDETGGQVVAEAQAVAEESVAEEETEAEEPAPPEAADS